MTNDYYPGQGCECSAHNRQECGCDVDWTDPRVYRLERELAASKEEIEHIKKLLKDPSAVHINLLRGNIAKLSWDGYEHIHGPHPCREEVARLREELEKAMSMIDRDMQCEAEVARLRELLENILDAVPASYREQYEQIIK